MLQDSYRTISQTRSAGGSASFTGWLASMRDRWTDFCNLFIAIKRSVNPAELETAKVEQYIRPEMGHKLNQGGKHSV